MEVVGRLCPSDCLMSLHVVCFCAACVCWCFLCLVFFVTHGKLHVGLVRVVVSGLSAVQAKHVSQQHTHRPFGQFCFVYLRVLFLGLRAGLPASVTSAHAAATFMEPVDVEPASRILDSRRRSSERGMISLDIVPASERAPSISFPPGCCYFLPFWEANFHIILALF